MVQNVNTATLERPVNGSLLPQSKTPSPSQTSTTSIRKDTVSFRATISTEQSQNIVLERAFEKLRAVVDEARAELGIPEGESIDISPEATGDRIADFALNFFSKYAENNGLDDDEAGRAKFAEFIGGAINQGIEEARGILTALSALDPNIATGIEKTASHIQGRLQDFVTNGLG